MRKSKFDLETRLAIGNAKLAGQDHRELAKKHGIGVTTVFAYAKEAEQFKTFMVDYKDMIGGRLKVLTGYLAHP